MHEGKALISRNCEGLMGLKPTFMQAEAWLCGVNLLRACPEMSPPCPQVSDGNISGAPGLISTRDLSPPRVRLAAQMEISFQRANTVWAGDKLWFPHLAPSPVPKGIIVCRAERRPESSPCLASPQGDYFQSRRSSPPSWCGRNSLSGAGVLAGLEMSPTCLVSVSPGAGGSLGAGMSWPSPLGDVV